MNFTGQLFTPTPPTSYIGRFSVSPEQLPYISEHTTFLFAELDAHNFFLAFFAPLRDSFPPVSSFSRQDAEIAKGNSV